MKKPFYTLFRLFLFMIAAMYGCRKFPEVPTPSYQIGSDQVFSNEGTATAAVLGIYSEMMNNPSQFSAGQLTLTTGLYSDELSYFGTSDKDEYMDSRLTEGRHPQLSSVFWAPAYRYIYTANLCLEKLEKSNSVSVTVKDQLRGELKFVRAFCYFNLVNLFGDIPLVLSSDYRVSASLPRTPVAAVYNQIVLDLTEAKQVLSATYPAPSSERIRPNRWAAAALLARVQLYRQNWMQAEAESSAVISSGAYSLLPNLNQVFLKNSAEAIWQLQPVVPGWNTWEGRDVLPASTTAAPTYMVRSELLAAFESGDQRRSAWTATRTFSGQQVIYPNKYKVYGNNAPLTEYYTVLRLAEQYLIRAEARAKQNSFTSAISDLNIIRARAGLLPLSPTDVSSLLLAIEKERRIELMAEWGHRWFDLKRIGKADSIIGALKPTTWKATQQLWPIPQNQINANPGLTQNPGY